MKTERRQSVFFILITLLFIAVVFLSSCKKEIQPYERDVTFINALQDTIIVRCNGTAWTMLPADTTHRNNATGQNYWGKQYKVYLIKNNEVCNYFEPDPPCFYTSGTVIGINRIR